MRKIRIVADSSADITAMEQVDFTFAPLKIICEEREFTDDASLDLQEMASFFETYTGKSKTSCPNVTDWLEAFGDADDVICVTITSGLSGSYNSACIAKRMTEAENSNRRVFVLDTLSAGAEISLVLERVRESVIKGMPFEDICADIQEYREKTGLLFMLKSLKNFANNGRVSPIVAKIAGFAGICIVGRASDEGTLEPSHKCRGEARSLETLVADLESCGFSKGKISIAHNGNEAAAEKLKGMIRQKFGQVPVEIHPCRGLCSFYAEKGGLLVGFEKNGCC